QPGCWSRTSARPGLPLRPARPVRARACAARTSSTARARRDGTGARPAEPGSYIVQMTRRAGARIPIFAFIVVVLAFFVLAIVNAWNATDGQLPSLGRLTVAGLLWGAGLLAAAYGWTTLLGTDHRLVHAAAFLVAQLGKYAPGGVVQATSQVGL